MLEYYPQKKFSLSLATFVVCFMLLVIVPSQSSYSAPPLQGYTVTVYLDNSTPTTTNSYLVVNGKGTYVIGAYFPANTFNQGMAGRNKVAASIAYLGLQEFIGNLIVYVNRDGSGLLVGTITGS